VTGGLFALTVSAVGVGLHAAFLLVFLAGLVLVSFIDLDHQIIPNAVTLPGIPLGLVAGLLVGEPPLLERSSACWPGGIPLPGCSTTGAPSTARRPWARET